MSTSTRQSSLIATALQVTGNTIGGVALLLLTLFSGYYILAPHMLALVTKTNSMAASARTNSHQKWKPSAKSQQSTREPGSGSGIQTPFKLAPSHLRLAARLVGGVISFVICSCTVSVACMTVHQSGVGDGATFRTAIIRGVFEGVLGTAMLSAFVYLVRGLWRLLDTDSSEPEKGKSQ